MVLTKIDSYIVMLAFESLAKYQPDWSAILRVEVIFVNCTKRWRRIKKLNNYEETQKFAHF